MEVPRYNETPEQQELRLAKIRVSCRRNVVRRLEAQLVEARSSLTELTAELERLDGRDRTLVHG